MRIYLTATITDLKTVKKQGAFIAEAWQRQNRVQVDVRAIKRIGNVTPEIQWGFIVLESMFGTYLCHYEYGGNVHDGIRLVVTPESLMSLDSPAYLACPERFLSMTEVENAYWRECVRCYSAAVKEVTSETVGDSATVFLLKGYSQREYGEPFHVLQKDGSQWFGIDCYRTKRPVNLCLGVIQEHCPSLINVQLQKPFESANLADDCVDTGVLIYKEHCNRVTLLGRPMTNHEIAQARLSMVPRVTFELHGECPWAA